MGNSIDMTPDLYSRNYIISNIVEQYRTQVGKKTLKILDVGGRYGRLEDFLPKDDITIIDIREGNEPNLIVGDATDMKNLFKDDEFDIVTSGDVYEHIPTEKKGNFITECLRVSKGLAIFACPFQSKAVNDAEDTIRKLFKKLNKIEHPWLKEHKEITLPDFSRLTDLLNTLEYKTQVFQSNTLDNWILFQTAACISYQRDVEKELAQVYKIYNGNLQIIEDSDIDFYRKVIVTSKKDLNFTFDYNYSPEAKVKFLSQLVHFFSTTIQNHTDSFDREFKLKEHHVNNLQSIIEQQKTSFVKQRKDLDAIIAQQEIAFAKQRKDLDTIIAQQKIAFENQLKDKETHINNLEAEIHNIKTSTTWKIFLLYKTSMNVIKHPHRITTRFCKSLKVIGAKATIRNIIRKVNPEFRQSTNPRFLTQQEQYNIWLSQHMLTDSDIKRKKKKLESFEYQPKISIIMPVYNVEGKWLRKAIESVQNQIYENWELCINDDASTQKHIKPILKKYVKKEKRIKIKFSKKNQHISRSSNEALELATGEFIALMDNDDELTANALFEVVKVLNKTPDLDFIYSDEDKLDEDGNRVEPFFKPDWSPDYFLSSMYTCHLGVYRKKIIDKIRGFRKGYEGAQDYDLVLRLTEKTDKIYHIPQILYHWRQIPGSTSAEYSEKSYAKVAAKKALTDTLKKERLKQK